MLQQKFDYFQILFNTIQHLETCCSMWPNVWNALRAKTFQDVACVWSGLKGPQTYHLGHHEKRELLNSGALKRYLVFWHVWLFL